MLRSVTIFNNKYFSARQSVARLRSFVKHFFVNYIKTSTAYYALFRGMVRRFCFARARDGPSSSVYKKAVMLL